MVHMPSLEIWDWGLKILKQNTFLTCITFLHIIHIIILIINSKTILHIFNTGTHKYMLYVELKNANLSIALLFHTLRP